MGADQWSAELVALQDRLQARGDQLKSKHSAHKSKHSAHVSTSAIPAALKATTHGVWAAELVALQERLQAHWDHLKLKHAAHKHSAHVSTSATPAHGDANSVVSSPTSSSSQMSQYEQHHNLHWRDVVAWQTAVGASALRGSGDRRNFAQVAKKELRHSKWGGMIPSVACVSVVPYGKNIKYQLPYFLDNFKLQNYEGMKQLILVYHHEDKATKKLLASHADGVRVKAVSAMGGSDATSPAFRFGAWVAKDVDVIARWDFDAWHDPSRLSMQIRAMALAKRPASRLRSWAVRNYSSGETMEDSNIDLRGEASLVGEKEWISQHWYPMLADEAGSLLRASAQHVVEFEFPELLVYDVEPSR